jgi:hypothetical protein
LVDDDEGITSRVGDAAFNLATTAQGDSASTHGLEWDAWLQDAALVNVGA